MGDRILRVNGVDVMQVPHRQAVEALTSNKVRVELSVRHDPQPIGYHELLIRKRVDETLGMNVRGGAKSANPEEPWIPGNPLDPNDDGIFISRVIWMACLCYFFNKIDENANENADTDSENVLWVRL